jgi:hypothetical protein
VNNCLRISRNLFCNAQWYEMETSIW